MSRPKTKRLSGVMAGLALLATAGASAQSTSNSPQARQALDEIIVTARKKEEALSDIPIAVTALTGQDIEAAGFENIKDLAKATPGFVFEGFDTVPGRFDSVPFIRGVTFDAPSPIRQPVSVFIDGVYVAGGTAGIGVEDVERVEVIKGPQSAQFGRATFAGAINYITVDPADEFQANISTTFASRTEYELTGSVEGPLFEGVTARLSGRYADKDGHYDNSVDTSQRLGDEQTKSIGLTLLFEPNDRFRARLRGFYSELDDGPAASALFDPSFNVLQPGGARAYFVGTLPAVPDSIIGQNSTSADFSTYIADARTIGVNFIGGEPDGFGVERESSRIALDASYDFGSIVLTGNFGVNSEEGLALYDFDQNPRTTFTFLAGREFDDVSGELRLAGAAFGDRLDWAIGVSRLEIEYNSTTGGFGFQAAGESVSFSGRPNGAAPQLRDVTTEAFFAQIGYAITDKWRFNVEAREQEDTIDLRVIGDPSQRESIASFDNFLPRFTLDYKPTDSTLLYASYSEGNLPGGFNGAFLILTPAQQADIQNGIPGVSPALPGAAGTFEEETLDNIEIGWKQSLLDNKLNFTLALYTMERTDQASTAVGTSRNPLFGDPNEPEFETTTLSINAAATDITGLELEGNYFPNETWAFNATFAYTDAEVSEFPASGDSGDFELAFGTSDGFIGTKAPRYPEYQASLSGTYSVPTTLFSADTWYVRGDLFYQDEFFLSTANLGLAPSSTEINLRSGIRADNWSFEAFVSNLTDEDAPTAANNTATSVTTGFFPFTEATSVGLRDKRQFGIRVNYGF